MKDINNRDRVGVYKNSLNRLSNLPENLKLVLK